MTHTVHTRIDGPLVMIGFGSIGRGTLPLIERHIAFDRDQFTVIEPSGEFAHILAEHGIKHLQVALTADNFDAVLRGLFPDGKGFIVNLSGLPLPATVASAVEMMARSGIPAALATSNKPPTPNTVFIPKRNKFSLALTKRSCSTLFTISAGLPRLSVKSPSRSPTSPVPANDEATGRRTAWSTALLNA